jgi:hypothetical protein
MSIHFPGSVRDEIVGLIAVLFCPFSFRESCVTSVIGALINGAGQLIVNGTLLTEAKLPFISASNHSMTVTYQPTTQLDLLPLLCNGADSFNVSAHVASDSRLSSPITTITLQLGCDKLVCGRGQQLVSAGSTGASKVCVDCQPGSYNLHINSTCKPCPVGGVCFGGPTLSASSGYWYSNATFYKCGEYRCCLQRDCDVSVSGADSLCAHGRAGPICSQCAHANHISWGVNCQECTSVNWFAVFLIFG